MGAVKGLLNTAKLLKNKAGKSIAKGTSSSSGLNTSANLRNAGADMSKVNVFGNARPSAANIQAQQNAAYYKSLQKGASENEIEKVVDFVRPSYLDDMIDLAGGYHKIATTMYPEYGNPEELGLIKAAEILGTKYLSKRRENTKIISGLEGLKDL